MDRSRIFRTWIESDLFKGLIGKLVLTRKTFEPVSPDFYYTWYRNDAKTESGTSYINSELSCILRYQPNATFIQDGVRRFPVNFNKYPVFSFEYFRGFKNLLNSDFNYHKIVADIYHNFNAGGIGSFEYDLSYTKIFDKLPYPLLIILAGNRSIFRTNRTYNLMKPGEFVLDEAVETFISYHMNGIVLNKIPLLKKLQWRTVFTAHAAFGSFNNRINGFYDPVTNPDGVLAETENQLTSLKSLSYDKPYLEVSYGIEDIFRFFRVDLIHRLTWIDINDPHRFGIKISGEFRF
jgi:hypothetical protein